MTNHLRIVLKHIQNSEMREVTSGSYQASKTIVQDAEAILITHLKFRGKEKFNTCKWIPRNKTIFICPGADAIPEEIIFTIRSIKRLGMKVEHIVSPSNMDVTSQFIRYL